MAEGIKIPPRLNGYEILAACAVFIEPGRPEANMMVVFGIDPSRRTGKYVTAMVDGRAGDIREWFWGHYFENADRATMDFFERTRYPLIAEQLRKTAAEAAEKADLKREEQRHEADR